jgi:NAD(P)-dependent dehydrogenase (short-subunit alcohol dehydrogenase family)
MAKVAVVTGASQGLGLAPVAAVKVQARELADEAARRDILVSAACLGLVDTDVSRPRRSSASPREPVSQAGQIANCSAGRFNGDPPCNQPRTTVRRTWSGAWPAGTGCTMHCAAPTPSHGQVRPPPL